LDDHRPYTEGPTIDPLGPTVTSTDRALRGGSFWNRARGVRAAYRYADPPGYADGNIGFRCLLNQR
jgi:formylglycine-generating enzyme required for sulfatase activity